MASVVAQVPFNSYTGNGVATVYSYEFQLLAAADLVATLNGVVTLDFVLSGVGVQTGGSVTFPVAPASGVVIVLNRVIALNRDTDYQYSGDLLEATLDRDFNRLWMSIQGVSSSIGGAVRAPYPEQMSVLPARAVRANTIQGYDGNGDPSVLVPVSGSAADVFLQLANGGSAAAGANIVGYSPLNAYTLGVGRRLNEEITTTGYASLQSAVTAAAGKRLFVIGAWTISAPVVILDNTHIILTPGSLVQSSTVNISMFTATAKSGIKIDGTGKIKMTGTGTAAYVAGVKLIGCTDCHVTGVVFEGMQWSAVMFGAGTTRCSARLNYVKAHLGTVQDANDIACYEDAVGNVIEANWLYGESVHGVLLQDPYTINGLTPKRNKVLNNDIGRHTGYGVAIYIPANVSAYTGSISGATLTVSVVANGVLAIGHAVLNSSTGVPYGVILSFGTGTGGIGTYTLDIGGWAVGSSSLVSSSLASTENLIQGNTIHDIEGSYATNRSSGNAVYMVGPGIGGTVIDSTIISNCCTFTLNRSLAPAGIGVNGVLPGMVRPLITNTSINGMPQGDGICITSCPGGVVVDGATINLPTTNNGAGVGGATMLGGGIRIENSSNVTVGDLDITVRGTGEGAFVYASASAMTDVTISGGQIVTNIGTGIRVDQAGGNTITGLTLDGPRVKANGASANAVRLASVIGGVVQLTGFAASQPAIYINSCTQLRVPAGHYTSNGAVAVETLGTCTGGFLDKAAYWSTGAASMKNAAIGFAVEWRSNASPAAGTWGAGDRTEQTVPVVTQPKGWRCTVAGAPGTWVSEGNL